MQLSEVRGEQSENLWVGGGGGLRILLVFVIVEPTLFISIDDALVSRHLVLVDRMRRPFVEAESNTVRVRQWGIV